MSVQQPTPGQRLELRLPAGAVTAEAEQLDGERLVVRCPSDLSIQQLAALHRGGELAYPGRHGMVVRAAVLSERQGDRLRFRLTTRREVVSRRDWARVDGLLEVVLHVDGRRLAATGVNISGGGMRCSLPEPLTTGTRVRAQIPLRDDGPPLEVAGEVLRREPSGQLAIVFRDVTEADRDRLAAHVALVQRGHLARGLR